VVSAAACSQVDQCVRHPLHARVPLLAALAPEPQSLAHVLSRTGPLDTPASGMDHGVAQPLAPTLGGCAVTWMLSYGGDQTRLENHLPIACGITAAIEVEIRASELHPNLFGHLLERVQALRS
jgi:hypothetical protein